MQENNISGVEYRSSLLEAGPLTRRRPKTIVNKNISQSPRYFSESTRRLNWTTKISWWIDIILVNNFDG